MAWWQPKKLWLWRLHTAAGSQPGPLAALRGWMVDNFYLAACFKVQFWIFFPLMTPIDKRPSPCPSHARCWSACIISPAHVTPLSSSSRAHVTTYETTSRTQVALLACQKMQIRRSTANELRLAPTNQVTCCIGVHIFLLLYGSLEKMAALAVDNVTNDAVLDWRRTATYR